jgi:hypothetical protein
MILGLISIFIFISAIVGPLLLFPLITDHPMYLRLETISYGSALPFLVIVILLYMGVYQKMTSDIKDKVRGSYFLPFFAFFFGIMASVSSFNVIFVSLCHWFSGLICAELSDY